MTKGRKEDQRTAVGRAQKERKCFGSHAPISSTIHNSFPLSFYYSFSLYCQCWPSNKHNQLSTMTTSRDGGFSPRPVLCLFSYRSEMLSSIDQRFIGISPKKKNSEHSQKKKVNGANGKIFERQKRRNNLINVFVCCLPPLGMEGHAWAALRDTDLQLTSWSRDDDSKRRFQEEGGRSAPPPMTQ